MEKSFDLRDIIMRVNYLKTNKLANDKNGSRSSIHQSAIDVETNVSI
jgi:hypothetical protein